MALDGISATASASARPLSDMNAAQKLAQANDGAAPRSEAADAFRETMGNIFDNATKYINNPGLESAKADPVQAAKNDILPSPYKAMPANGGGADAGGGVGDVISAQSKALQEGNKTLKQSFDHAIFVTLVSQVISGVSQTTSTLVRQQ